ncbi:MAG: transcription antitermination factor NusB [Alphaproteobacteria bacterium]|nr:transcription antitermination factor NusB [Alphaproteobacteria bacterium]
MTVQTPATNPAAPGGKAGGQSAARRSARIVAAQTLYRLELGPEKIDDALKTVLTRTDVAVDPVEPPEGELVKPDNVLVADIVRGAAAEREKIDALIAGALDAGWPLQRLEAILRAILRAGVFELLNNPKTAPGLIITDYVDVTHAFCEGKEPGMVNAVLDKVARALK